MGFNGLLARLKRHRWRNVAAKTIFSHLYQAPLISPHKKVSTSRFLVVDCEMTGLSVERDTLVSIGWVNISNNMIDLASARHMRIYTQDPVGKSATIHGLFDHDIAGGTSIAQVLSLFAHAANGKVLVFHHAHLDVAFLQRAALSSIGCPLLFPYVDTMVNEQRRQALQNRTDSLQLNLIRTRYNLPDCLEHNALEDARATAELFLAQQARMGDEGKLRLKDLGMKYV